ncbi:MULTISPECIES: chemotaxis-specific protein-glutamate methyltransferase CheB [Spirulina sp. CCY15215]|uniref:chemotaxis-specific protein-glutamate methyltransferase CheB n=1 Tax=Spirulina sp. CCY15215 TaxID=2767591 RepID=UPI00194FAB61|nr:chemotaxis-specific protein-glutamate methyltransferase CheB [Spirulina major]
MKIKVLIVEDSPIALVILKRILNSAHDIEVVGTAGTGLEALSLIAQTQPDVICTDLHMPKMNGLELTKEILATDPRPILAVSSSVGEDDRHNVFELLEAGALDVFPKPQAANIEDYEAVKQALIAKIRILAGVKVFRKLKKQVPRSSSLPSPSPPPFASPPISSFGSRIKLIAIGSSTGGPQALKTIFSSFPASFPIPIVCVQHITQGFLQGLLEWLGNNCRLTLRVANIGEMPQGGTIYFPPEGLHLELDEAGRFYYSSRSFGSHRPSVDVLFESTIRYYRASVLGVLLTGMGRDGAEGMQAISKAGGHTIAQNEASCVVFGMPKEAIALGGVKQVLGLEAIAPAILSRVRC